MTVHTYLHAHLRTSGNYWDFSTWLPHAVVINLGTNDQLESRPDLVPHYNATYLSLVLAAAKVTEPVDPF